MQYTSFDPVFNADSEYHICFDLIDDFCGQKPPSIGDNSTNLYLKNSVHRISQVASLF
jgi:hypothetical protein